MHGIDAQHPVRRRFAAEATKRAKQATSGVRAGLLLHFRVYRPGKATISPTPSAATLRISLDWHEAACRPRLGPGARPTPAASRTLRSVPGCPPCALVPRTSDSRFGLRL